MTNNKIIVENGIISFEGFKAEMEWNTIDFTPEQLEAIYNSVNTEYATFEELDETFEITENEDFVSYKIDVNLHCVVEYLNDLEDTEIIKQVLTSPYGYNGTSATIYYLKEDNAYCLLFDN